MGARVAKMLLRSQKHSAFRCFSSTFKRTVFEKGLFRQFQRFALFLQALTLQVIGSRKWAGQDSA